MVLDSINLKKINFVYNNIFPIIHINESHYIYTDEKWMGYVIGQIITNSIKYAPYTKYITFYYDESKKDITLHIKDEGIGIKKEELNRVFDPFFTGSNGRIGKKSTGIGLYMCKNICKMLNSKIDIESQEGIGTIVSITFQKCNVM